MNLKRIMTDLAAGRITKGQADNIIKGIKVPQNQSVGKFKGKKEIAPINSEEGIKQRDKAREKILKNTHKRKELIKTREVK